MKKLLIFFFVINLHSLLFSAQNNSDYDFTLKDLDIVCFEQDIGAKTVILANAISIFKRIYKIEQNPIDTSGKNYTVQQEFDVIFEQFKNVAKQSKLPKDGIIAVLIKAKIKLKAECGLEYHIFDDEE